MAKRKFKELTAKERKVFARKLEKISASARAKDMYRMRYGLDSGIFMTLAAVGKHFGVTFEAVRLAIIKVQNLINGK